MSSTQETVNKSISVDDMLDEIPEPPIIDHQHQINNDKISDSDDSFKSIENFVPIKLKFIKKFAKVSGKIAKDDLEELLLLKVTESMVYRTKYAEIRVKLDIYEDLMQRQRTRLELLEKQYADLQVTHERILTAMRENPQAPIEPLKIVRAVSCQVYQQSAEYVNTDPIVIGDSPKKRRTMRRNNENMTEKGRNDKVAIDSSSSGRKQDKSKENKSFEDRSSNKQINDDKLNQTGSSTKNTSNSSEKDLESNKKQTKTADQNSSRSRNNKTTDSQKSSKSNQNPEENELNSLNFDKVLTSSESKQAQMPNKRGTKRKATTILEMFEKKAKNSTEDTKASANNQKSKISKENESKNRSRSSQYSDSDNDVTLIEDDEDEPKTTKNKQTLKFSSELDFELPRALKKLAKATKLIESSAKTTDNKSKTDNITSTSKKTDEKSINITSKIEKLTSNISKNTKNDDKTVKQSNLTSKLGSSSPDSNIGSPESVLSSSPEPEHSIPVQKSFKVPTTKPKAIRPGPKCSKLSNQIVGTGKLGAGDSIPQESSSLLEVSNKLLNGSNRFENNFKNPQNMARNLQNGGSNLYKNVNYPSSATKIPPSPFDSAKKSTNFDRSFDSLNFSSCSSLDTLSSFKSSANLVTSTPLKAVDQGQAKTVKRTLDMNFNENSSSKVPKLPTRGPQLIHPSLKQSIPAPTIKVEKVNNGIRISWRIDNFKASDHADVQSYQIYAYEEMPGSAKISTDDWKLVGDVKALLLPMAVTLREFNENQKFHFAIRAVDVHKRLGEFSEPKSWE